jgi:hypothetical protein
MKVNFPFKVSEKISPNIFTLLKSTTLGTNGAMYVHQNTEEIIDDLDQALFFYLERNENVIGNVTFCRREQFWYIRYFAFDKIFQSKKSKVKAKNSILKSQLSDVFNQEGINFYAYIEPNNLRSKFMAENFAFEKIGALKTLTFSRLNPKLSKNLIEISDIDTIFTLNSQFKNQLFYNGFCPKRTKVYGLKDENNQIIASARVQKAHWEIKRLPGKFGGILLKLIPFVPILNRFLKPKNHHFLVLDAVNVSNEKDLSLLFESILAKEKYTLIFLWIDEKDELLKLQKKVNWGLFSYFIGNPKVDVVAKINNESTMDFTKTFYVSGIDLI